MINREKIASATQILKKILVPAILFFVLCALASFATNQHKSQVCKKVIIKVLDEDDYQFVTRQKIINAINKNGSLQIKGSKLQNIDLPAIEDRLLKNPFVRTAQAFVDMQGNLTVKITQRVPVMRVHNPAYQAYYLDKQGERMPLSSNYTAFVPVATSSYSNISEENKDSVLHKLDSNLFQLSLYMENDSFAKAITGQIIIEPNNEFGIVPRLGNFKISLGDANDLDDKFKRLKSFYRLSLPQAGWDKYTRISVKYKNQIVATRQ